MRVSRLGAFWYHVYLLSIVIAVIYGFLLRQPYIGTLADWHQQWLTASIKIFVENWQEEGFWKLHGAMLDSPRLLDTPTLDVRRLYPSFLPGAPIEIFLLKQLFPSVNILYLIHCFNLLNQLAIALVIGAIVYFSASTQLTFYRFIFATTATLTYLLHPSPFYWHAMVFFGEIAVIFPIGLALLLEILIRKSPDKNSHLLILQSLCIAIAGCMEWLTFFTVLWIMFFRWVVPLPKTSKFLSFIHPASGLLAMIIIYIIQMYSLGLLPAVYEKIVSHSLLSHDDESITLIRLVNERFWLYLGTEQVLMLSGTLACVIGILYKNRQNVGACVSAIALLMCPTQFLFFKIHSWHHDFSALKFILPLSLVTFGWLPLTFLDFIHKYMKRDHRKHYLLPLSAALLVVLWACFLCDQRKDWQNWFPSPTVENAPIAEWLRQNAHYDDLFVAKSFEIATYAPQKIAIARHRVFKIIDKNQWYSMLQRYPQASFYAVLRLQETNACKQSTTGAIANISSEKTEWFVYKIDRKDVDVWADCLSQSKI